MYNSAKTVIIKYEYNGLAKEFVYVSDVEAVNTDVEKVLFAIYQEIFNNNMQEYKRVKFLGVYFIKYLHWISMESHSILDIVNYLKYKEPEGYNIFKDLNHVEMLENYLKERENE